MANISFQEPPNRPVQYDGQAQIKDVSRSSTSTSFSVMSNSKNAKDARDTDSGSGLTRLSASNGPVKKARRRDKLKNAMKSRSSASPDKYDRKDSGASQETLREAAMHRARSPHGSQKDQKNATNSFIAVALVKDIYNSDTANDAEIVREFKALEKTVKTWSGDFVHSIPDQIPELSAEDLTRLAHIAPERIFPESLKNLLQYSSDRRQVAKGYVYRILYERIFAIQYRGSTSDAPQCTDLCITKEAAQGVATLESILRAEVEGVHEHDKPEAPGAADNITQRDLHTWRSYTMTLLSRTCVSVKDPNSAVFEQQSTEIQQAIWSLLSGWLPPGDHVNTRNGLTSIVTNAIRLMQVLRKQRAYWTIAYPTLHPASTTGRQLFDPSTMVDRDTSQGKHGDKPQESLRNRPIELMIRPALFKRGDASGNKFEMDTCLERAEVRCRQS